MKTFLALFLVMFSIPTVFVFASEKVALSTEKVTVSADMVTISVTDSNAASKQIAAKVKTWQARKAPKTATAAAAAVSTIGRVEAVAIGGDRFEVSYNRGTEVGSFKVERATRLTPSHDFQPPVPGEIVAARTSNGVVTWTFSGAALELANGGTGGTSFRVLRP